MPPVVPEEPRAPEPQRQTSSVGGVIADICIAVMLALAIADIWYDILLNIGRHGAGIVPYLLSSGLALLVGYAFGFLLKPPGQRPYRFWRTYLLRFLLSYGLAIVAGLLGIWAGLSDNGPGARTNADVPSALLVLFVGTGLPIAISLLIFHAVYRRVGHLDSWFAGMANAVRAVFQAFAGATVLVVGAAVFLVLDIMFSPPTE